MSGVQDIRMEPMDLYLGNDQVQIQKITCVADVASSLQNKMFFFYDSSGAKHFGQYNVATLGTPSVISGYTAHPIAIASGASASAVASATAAVLTAVSGFDATSSGSAVTLTATANGYALLAHDAQASADQTEFAFELTQVGDLYEKMGLLDGDVAVSGLSRSPVDITAHQTGTSVIGQIFSGFGNPELAVVLKEVTTTNIEKLNRYAGGSYLPVGGSNKLVGGGSLGQFKAPQYAKVVLHPVRLDVADKTFDFCFWKATIDLDSITFSGENLLNLPVNIKSFNDESKPKAISTWMFGDWSQSLV